MSWNKRPLHEFIYSIISKKKQLSFDDLWKIIKEESENLGRSEIKNTLIKLEIWGKIDLIREGNSKKILLKSNKK